MKKFALLLFIALASCKSASSPAPAKTETANTGQVISINIPGAALDGDMAADETPRSALIYLPADYETSGKRYPVLVLLHGFWSSPRQWEDNDFSLVATFRDAVAAGEARDMIVVMPSGADQLNGGFYVNGAATGNWEDYVAEDVVAHVDGAYRTLASRESRGIAGHSMGGYGALSVAAARPDVFSAVYAMSPCCGDLVGDFALDAPTWAAADAIATKEDFAASEDFHGVVLTALGAAWAADSNAPLFSRRPVEDGAVDAAVLAKWQARTLTGLVASHADNLRRYTAIGLDVGDREDFPHILQSVPALSAQLTELGIAHDYEMYPGDHVSGIGAQMREEVLPFFSQHLTRE
jgi:S-formylglutathione hydrolase FrmB